MIEPGTDDSRRVTRPGQRLLRIVSGGKVNVFDDLFGALKMQLRETAAQCPASAQPLRDRILDCAAALEHAQARIVPGIVRQRQIERGLRSVSLALQRAKAELADTQAREKEARHLAMHDALTTLPNRRFFQQRLDLALSSAPLQPRALAVLYIDLNGFKVMNDAHGHHTGDHMLQIVAARLKHSMRAEDMVCRLGGDEFGCMLTGLKNRSQISQVAVKVFEVIAAPLRLGDVTLAVPPSIGIAVAPGDGATSTDLLVRADAAMYHARHFQTHYSFFGEAFPKGMTPRLP
jgi:diguanylate cyclase (GGDEF)-like protein